MTFFYVEQTVNAVFPHTIKKCMLATGKKKKKLLILFKLLYTTIATEQNKIKNQLHIIIIIIIKIIFNEIFDGQIILLL